MRLRVDASLLLVPLLACSPASMTGGTGGGTAGGAAAGGAAGGGDAGGGNAGGASGGASGGAAGGTAGGGAAGGVAGGAGGTIITVGVGGDRRYSTRDGNVTIQGDVQDLPPNDPDWADGHTDTMIRGLCYGNGRFLAVGGQSRSTYRSTTNGLTWTPLATLDGMGGRPTGDWFGGCAYGNGRFVAAGGNGTRCHSPDGVNWACPSGLGQSRHHRAVAFGGGRFVTVGNSYASVPMNVTSVTTDGVSWSDLPTPNNASANRIIYVPAHARFYAAFGAELGSLADGATAWSVVAGVNVTGLGSMTERNGTVYLLGYDNVRYLRTSPDGTAWTSTTVMNLESIHWNLQSRFIGNRRQYPQPVVPWRRSSPDGVAWTEVAESNTLHSVDMFVSGAIFP